MKFLGINSWLFRKKKKMLLTSRKNYCKLRKRQQTLRNIYCLTLVLMTLFILTIIISEPGLQQINDQHTSSQPPRRKVSKIEYADGYEYPQACIIPNLNPYEPAIIEVLSYKEGPTCKEGLNWFIIREGKIFFSVETLKEVQTGQCSLEFYKKDDTGKFVMKDFRILFISHPQRENIEMSTPYVVIDCKGITFGGKIIKMRNTFTGISTPQKEKKIQFSPENRDRLSVVMIGFESMSSKAFQRQMNGVRNFFLKYLGGIEMEGFTAMGHDPASVLVPLLSGNEKLAVNPTTNKKKNLNRWLWEDFSRNGYLTAYAHASPTLDPLRLEKMPTFLNMSHYFTFRRQLKQHGYCHGTRPLPEVWFDYLRDILATYKDRAKCVYHYYHQHHDTTNASDSVSDGVDAGFLSTFGDELLGFLQELRGHLDNTILVLFSTHGSNKADSVSKTLPGMIETKLPFLGIRLPPWMKSIYPEKVKNLKANSRMLTTPSDLYWTFKNILEGISIEKYNNLENNEINDMQENKKTEMKLDSKSVLTISDRKTDSLKNKLGHRNKMRKNKFKKKFDKLDFNSKYDTGVYMSLFDRIPYSRKCEIGVLKNSACPCFKRNTTSPFPSAFTSKLIHHIFHKINRGLRVYQKCQVLTFEEVIHIHRLQLNEDYLPNSFSNLHEKEMNEMDNNFNMFLRNPNRIIIPSSSYRSGSFYNILTVSIRVVTSESLIFDIIVNIDLVSGEIIPELENIKRVSIHSGTKCSGVPENLQEICLCRY